MRRFSLLSVVVGIISLLGALSAPGPALAQAAQATPTELTYFADTAQFRAHLVENQQWLEGIQQAAQTGHFDEVTTDELSNLTRELYSAQQGFARAVPSQRLMQYDLMVKASLDRAYTAAVLLIHAQVTESGPNRDSLIHDAAGYTANSGRLLKDAAEALRETNLAVQ